MSGPASHPTFNPKNQPATASEALEGYLPRLADYIEHFLEHETPPEDWEEWLTTLFPNSVESAFGDHHIKLWEWLWAIEPKQRPRPFIAVWPRGGAKSTTGELGIIAAGARETRRYVVVVSSSQDQANKRVGEIAAKLESKAIEKYYPALGQRAIGKYGSAKGWRRSRLHTASGFVVDGLGIEVAMRGLKAEDRRPDFIVLDDIDSLDDTEKETDRKVRTLTDTVLPMGDHTTAVLALQNLIIPDGVFARLVRGKADWLVDRIVSGPIPSVRDLELETETLDDGSTRYVIVGGEATWEGQDIEACQAVIDTRGPGSFLRECQHEVDESLDALWTKETIEDGRITPQDFAKDIYPHLEMVIVAVDPQGVKKEGSETGIVCGGLKDGHAYITLDSSINGTPSEWGRAAVDCLDANQADWIVGEKNFGGEMVENTVKVVRDTVPFRFVNASRGKKARAQPVAALSEMGRLHIVGQMPRLEKELVTWYDGCGWSPNRLDAMVWCVHGLMPELAGEKRRTVAYGKIRL